MVNHKDNMRLHELRVQRRPYIIYLLCMLFFVWASWDFLYESFVHDNGEFLGVFSAFLFSESCCLYLIAAFWFYRIELFEDVLIDKGLKRTKKAPIAAITKLKLETGDGNEKRLSGSTLRPFRRLAVYYTVDNKLQSLDISLVHFYIQDVRELLSALIELRPDLEVPKNFLKQKKVKSTGSV